MSSEILPTKAASDDVVSASGAAAGELPEGHRVLKEGEASIIYNEAREVFYNNVQVFNRDLSVLMLSLFAEQFQTEQLTRKRRLKPTWDTWGAVPPAAKAAVSVPIASASSGDSKDGEAKEAVESTVAVSNNPGTSAGVSGDTASSGKAPSLKPKRSVLQLRPSLCRSVNCRKLSRRLLTMLISLM